MASGEKTRFLDKKVGNCRVIDLCMLFFVAATIAMSVFLVIHFTADDHRKKTETVEVADQDSCLDVAIIGGGVGGAYTGWKLREKNLAVSVFEYTDRIGGRLFSADLPVVPGTYLELGGMRFMPQAHPILYNTTLELGLKVVPFKLGFGLPEETLWYSRSKRMRVDDVLSTDFPYMLEPNEKVSTSTLFRDLVVNNTNVPKDKELTETDVFALVTKDGTPLYKMSILNFLSKYGSREAYEYIKDMGAWAYNIGAGSAVQSAKELLLESPGSSRDFRTIKGGLQLLPITLMRKFKSASDKHQVHMNHWLEGMDRRQKGGFQLRFRKTRTINRVTSPIESNSARNVICAKRVILALPKQCVEEIDFPVFRDNKAIKDNIDTVESFPLGKIFLAYKRNWWKDNNPNITHTKSDLMNKQTYQWLDGGENVSIILGSYHDADAADFWAELRRFGAPIPGSLPGENAVTDAVKDMVEKYLSLIYDVPVEDIPDCIGGGMMLWNRFPYPSGVDMIKPDVNEDTIRKIVERPSPVDDVFVVTNSWAHRGLNGWVEGCLVSANDVLNKYF